MEFLIVGASAFAGLFIGHASGGDGTAALGFCGGLVFGLLLVRLRRLSARLDALRGDFEALRGARARQSVADVPTSSGGALGSDLGRTAKPRTASPPPLPRPSLARHDGATAPPRRRSPRAGPEALVQRRQRAGQDRHAGAVRRRRRAAALRFRAGLASLAGGAAPRRDRARGIRRARLWLARARAPAQLRPRPAGRRDRRAAAERVRRLPALSPAARRRRVRAAAGARRQRRRAGGAAGCAGAGHARRPRRVRRTDPDRDRPCRSRRPVLVLRAAQPGDLRDRLVPPVARAEPARFRVHLGDRDRLGRIALRAGAVRQQRTVPAAPLRDLSGHPDPVRAAAGAGTPRPRRRQPGVWQPAPRLRGAGCPARWRARAAGVERAGVGRGVRGAGLDVAAARTTARAGRGVRGARGRLRDSGGAVRVRRAQQRVHVCARRRGAGLAWPARATPVAAARRSGPAGTGGAGVRFRAGVRCRCGRQRADRQRRLPQRAADCRRRVRQRGLVPVARRATAAGPAAVPVGPRLVARRRLAARSNASCRRLGRRRHYWRSLP